MSEGDPSHLLERERFGNLQAKFVFTLCYVLHICSVLFAVENPRNSFILASSWFHSLAERVVLYQADFCQCGYGLVLPGAASNTFCEKSTRVVSILEQSVIFHRSALG